MKNNNDIFISYSRHDLEQVKLIKEEIERITGASCWMECGIRVDASAKFCPECGTKL